MSFLWFYATLASAAVWGFIRIIAKKLMKDTTSFNYTLLFFTAGALFYLPTSAYIAYITSLNFTPLIIAALLISITVNVVAQQIRNRAIQLGEISTIIPLTRTTPVFASIIEIIVLKPVLSNYTLAGVVLVTLGSYVVMLEKETSALEPLKNLVQNRAELLALASSAIIGIGAPAARYATQRIDPLIYISIVYFFTAFNLSLIMAQSDEKNYNSVKSEFFKNLEIYLGLGLMASTASFLTFFSYSLAPVSKVLPVLQVQVLIPVIIGGKIFHEGGILRKTIGSLILIAGVTLVTI